MKGYKAFNFDLSCRPFVAQLMMYEIGKPMRFLRRFK